MKGNRMNEISISISAISVMAISGSRHLAIDSYSAEGRTPDALWSGMYVEETTKRYYSNQIVLARWFSDVCEACSSFWPAVPSRGPVSKDGCFYNYTIQVVVDDRSLSICRAISRLPGKRKGLYLHIWTVKLNENTLQDSQEGRPSGDTV